MHDDVDVWVADQRGDRGQRGALDRVDQMHPAVDRDLRQAGHRRVGPLPEELEIERDAPVLVGCGNDGGDATGVSDDL